MKYSWEPQAGIATDGREIQGSLPSGWDTWAALAAAWVSQCRAACAKRTMCCDHTTKTTTSAARKNIFYFREPGNGGQKHSRKGACLETPGSRGRRRSSP